MTTELKTTGIVLRSTEVGESDKLVTLLTPEYGKLTVRAKGCRSAKSKLRFATLPMCTGEYLLTKSKAGYIVTGCDCIDAFPTVENDLAKFYVAAVLLDGADKLSGENVADATLFLTLLNTLKKCAYHEDALYTGAYYLLELMRLSGHAIRLFCQCGEAGDYIDLEQAAFCCEQHKGAACMPLTASARESLVALAEGKDVGQAGLRECYVILARCLYYAVGVKLMSVQELCKQWNVISG